MAQRSKGLVRDRCVAGIHLFIINSRPLSNAPGKIARINTRMLEMKIGAMIR